MRKQGRLEDTTMGNLESLRREDGSLTKREWRVNYGNGQVSHDMTLSEARKEAAKSEFYFLETVDYETGDWFAHRALPEA